MNLQEMLFIARSQLRDLGMKKWSEAELIASANAGKGELVSLIRQAREDYFYASTTSTVAVATAPNPSTLTLPTDFLELKELTVTTDGYTDLEFASCDKSRKLFRHALLDGASLSNGVGTILYDIYGNSVIMFAPGFDVELTIQVDYIKDIPDMVLMTDTISDIPTYLHDYIPTYIVVDAMRTMRDPRFNAFKNKLDEAVDALRINVQPRQIREAKYVSGFMEDEGWGG